MRCAACNKNLTDFESTRKTEDGSYLDLCNSCATIAGVNKTEDRFDLVSLADYIELEDYDVEDGSMDFGTGAEKGIGFDSDDY